MKPLTFTLVTSLSLYSFGYLGKGSVTGDLFVLQTERLTELELCPVLLFAILIRPL